MWGISIRIPIIIRLHTNKKKWPESCIFLQGFFEFVDSLATNSDHLLILGDFNIHSDCRRNPDTKQLADIVRSANSRKNRQHGHILDLVISHDGDNLIKGVSVSSMFFDHFLIILLALMFHYRNNLFQLIQFTSRLFFLICESPL